MNLTFNDEQEELRASVRRFLVEKAPMSEVRRVMDTAAGYNADVWSQMADQLGLQGLIIPAEYGGAGFTYVELAVVLEEMGRALLCSPFFATIAMAANAILLSEDEKAKRDVLPGIANGSTIATLAVAEDDGSWDVDSVQCRAIHTEDGWQLEGHKSFVVDGHIADLILVAARSDAGIGLFAIEADTEGFERTTMMGLDPTRRLARMEFSDSPCRLVGVDGGARESLSRTLDRAAIANSLEQVGAAQRCLEMSVDYAKVRIQFGRPIGSFQAIKHKCADMLLDVESAKSAAYYAAWLVALNSEEVAPVASMAKAYCSDAYFRTAAENIQVHGGIGYTWEHDAHLYFRRAKASELLLGDPVFHRELLAQRIGL
jgi:alkylation response protein AidB-like acyl-CoA dehydrogenase